MRSPDEPSRARQRMVACTISSRRRGATPSLGVIGPSLLDAWPASQTRTGPRRAAPTDDAGCGHCTGGPARYPRLMDIEVGPARRDPVVIALVAAVVGYAAVALVHHWWVSGVVAVAAAILLWRRHRRARFT